mgnify:CR=1 FL=1
MSVRPPLASPESFFHQDIDQERLPILILRSSLCSLIYSEEEPFPVDIDILDGPSTESNDLGQHMAQN